MRQKNLCQIHINVRPDQIADLRRLWESTGRGISELVRLALDNFLERVENGRKTSANGPAKRPAGRNG